jgi:hypothetical protein
VPFVVTGISQDGNTAALEAAIKAAGLALDAFEVICPGDADEAVAGGIATSGIITGGGGLETGVPGLSGSGVPGVSGGTTAAELGSGSLSDRLADLAIPNNEVENYAEALEAGRSIVAYHGTMTVPQLESLFAGSRLTKVKTF